MEPSYGSWVLIELGYKQDMSPYIKQLGRPKIGALSAPGSHEGLLLLHLC